MTSYYNIFASPNIANRGEKNKKIRKIQGNLSKIKATKKLQTFQKSGET